MQPSGIGPIPGLGYANPSAQRPLTRVTDAGAVADAAAVAEEVPVAFVYNTEPFVVVMATPVDLEDLGVGFSISEGIVGRSADVDRIEVVRQSRGIELQIGIPDESMARLADRRRGLNARTGCGLCGIEAIDEVLKQPDPVSSGASFTHAALWRAAAELEARQPINNETRSVHAAAFADRDGQLQVVREDVGRHNALDKVIGSLARSGTDPSYGFLVVTSRASYELVQKAAVAGIPLLAAVSRPTGLAVQLADQAGITLVGLLRGRTANVYSHVERLTPQ